MSLHRSFHFLLVICATSKDSCGSTEGCYCLFKSTSKYQCPVPFQIVRKRRSHFGLVVSGCAAAAAVDDDVCQRCQSNPSAQAVFVLAGQTTLWALRSYLSFSPKTKRKSMWSEGETFCRAFISPAIQPSFVCASSTFLESTRVGWPDFRNLVSRARCWHSNVRTQSDVRFTLQDVQGSFTEM